jgi:predicted alpha/beta-hydrolase family hydrolase
MRARRFSVPFRSGSSLEMLVDGEAAGRPLLLLAHGANGGPQHPLLAALAVRLAAGGLAVVRSAFPFHAEGRRSPNSDTVLGEALETVWMALRERFPGRLYFLGGKSLGARIAAMVAPRLAPLPVGLVYLGYPLHAPGRRAEILPAVLSGVALPQLFVQGGRDVFGTAEELGRLLAKQARLASVFPVPGGDHSLRCLAGTDAVVQETVAAAVIGWIGKINPRPDRSGLYRAR